MSRACRICIMCLLMVFFATETFAETRVLTFDSNNWGTSPFGTWNTTKSFQGDKGNPGACVLYRGIGGVGGSFANNGFTGDFAAAGFGRISFDLKKKHWFLRPNNQMPRAFMFVQKQGCWPWKKEIQGFDPMAEGYRNYFVTFNPNWTDAEAQANGWSVYVSYGTATTIPFSDTLHNVMRSGFWIQEMAPAECHVYVDNWKLSSTGLTPMMKPVPMKIAPGVKPSTKMRYPVRQKK